MSGTLPYTYINAFVNTVIHPSGNTLKQRGNNRTETEYLFKLLRKCDSKFDCFVYEILCIKVDNGVT